MSISLGPAPSPGCSCHINCVLRRLDLIPLQFAALSTAVGAHLLAPCTCSLCFIWSFGHIRYRSCAFLHAPCEVWVWYWQQKRWQSSAWLSSAEKLYFMRCLLSQWMRLSEWIAVHSISIASVWSDNHNADIANAIAMGNCHWLMADGRQSGKGRTRSILDTREVTEAGSKAKTMHRPKPMHWQRQCQQLSPVDGNLRGAMQLGWWQIRGGEEGCGRTRKDLPASKIAFIWHVIDSQHLALFN